MAELKLVGLCTISERQDLVSQADSENGIFATQRPYGFNGLGHICGIAGTVGNHDSVRLQGANDLRGRVPGDDRDITAAPVHGAEDVLFHAAVDEDDMKRSGSQSKGVPDFFAADTGYSIRGKLIAL